MKSFFASACVFVLTLLAGCGGGGGDSPTAPPPPVVTPPALPAAGLWQGTLRYQVRFGRYASLLAFGDGQYYLLYSPFGCTSTVLCNPVTSGPYGVEGFAYGKYTVEGDRFLSTRPLSFDHNSITTPPGLTATFVAKASLQGNYDAPPIADTTNGGNNLVTTYDADFERAPSLVAIAGSYSGRIMTEVNNDARFTVSASGAVAIQDGACNPAGQIRPRTDANAFDVSLTFAVGSCRFSGQTLNGIAYLHAPTKLLVIAATNAAGTSAVLVSGSQP